jgi:hypothetical protein
MQPFLVRSASANPERVSSMWTGFFVYTWVSLRLHLHGKRPLSRWFRLLFRVSVLLDTNSLNASLDVNKAKKKSSHSCQHRFELLMFDLMLKPEWPPSTWGAVLCSAGAWPLRSEPRRSSYEQTCADPAFGHLFLSTLISCQIKMFRYLYMSPGRGQTDLHQLFVDVWTEKSRTAARMGAMQTCFSASMPTVACRPWT